MMPTLFGKVVKTGAINASQLLITPLKELALPKPPWLVAPKPGGDCLARTFSFFRGGVSPWSRLGKNRGVETIGLSVVSVVSVVSLVTFEKIPNSVSKKKKGA